MKIVFDETCLEYKHPNHPEVPERVIAIKEALEGVFDFIKPRKYNEKVLEKVHEKGFIRKLKQRSIYDLDTPPLDFRYVFTAVCSAITASEVGGFSLSRPPGHHSGRDFLGGFCYLNNIAVALGNTRFEKAAVLDIDVHHGNGTEDIFFGRNDVIYVSLHQRGIYPGTGLKSTANTYNFPLPAGTDGKRYLKTLEKALEIIEVFDPDVLGVSLGFDTYVHDPLGGFLLKPDDFREIGKALGKISEGRKFFIVLEGGYSMDIHIPVISFFEGLSL